MKQKRVYFLIALILCLVCLDQAFALDHIISINAKGAAGEFDNPIMQERYPNILWEKQETGNLENVMELAQALVNRSGADIYALNYAQSNFDDIVRKGYAVPLNDDVALVNAIGQMYPFIQESVIRNGELYALPISLSCSHWAYSRTAFEAIGFNDDDVPNDYISLLSFIDWWIEEGSYDYPDVSLIRGAQDTRRAIIERIVQDMIDYCWYSEQPITFNTPEMRDLFQKLDDIDTGKGDAGLASLTEGDTYQHHVLFDVNYDWFNIEQSEENNGFIAFPIPVLKGQTHIVPVDMRIFIVNAGSLEQDSAMLYLSTYFEGMDALYSILAMQNAKEPLINEYATEPLRQAYEEVSHIQEELKRAGEAETKNLEDDLIYAKRSLDRLTLIQWRVTTERLMDYQSTIPYFYIRKYSPIGFLQSTNVSDISKLVNQYIQRHINAAEFLLKMDQIIQYVIIESGG